MSLYENQNNPQGSNGHQRKNISPSDDLNLSNANLSTSLPSAHFRELEKPPLSKAVASLTEQILDHLSDIDGSQKKTAADLLIVPFSDHEEQLSDSQVIALLSTAEIIQSLKDEPFRASDLRWICDFACQELRFWQSAHFDNRIGVEKITAEILDLIGQERFTAAVVCQDPRNNDLAIFVSAMEILEHLSQIQYEFSQPERELVLQTTVKNLAGLTQIIDGVKQDSGEYDLCEALLLINKVSELAAAFRFTEITRQLITFHQAFSALKEHVTSQDYLATQTLFGGNQEIESETPLVDHLGFTEMNVLEAIAHCQPPKTYLPYWNYLLKDEQDRNSPTWQASVIGLALADHQAAEGHVSDLLFNVIDSVHLSNQSGETVPSEETDQNQEGDALSHMLTIVRILDLVPKLYQTFEDTVQALPKTNQHALALICSYSIDCGDVVMQEASSPVLRAEGEPSLEERLTTLFLRNRK